MVIDALPAHGESVITFSTSLSDHSVNGLVSQTPAAEAASVVAISRADVSETVRVMGGLEAEQACEF
jgi:hypothetical protein